MKKDLTYSNSDELCEKLAEECNGKAILAFSMGKDSIAAWLQMRKYFDEIHPYFCWIVPEMEFQERMLDYYEDFFATDITRLPHSGYFKYLREGQFQYPFRYKYIGEFEVPTAQGYNDSTCVEIMRSCFGLGDDVLAGTGVRMADSPLRRVATQKYGAVNYAKGVFMPVYDWRKADLLQQIDAAGVKLPVDYKIWGRTFDGLDYRFVKPLKDNFPDDYEKLLSWYPLAELEIARRDGFDTIIHNDREGFFE